MQQQADDLPEPAYILASDRYSDTEAPTKQELKAAAAKFKEATNSFLQPTRNLKEGEVDAMMKAQVYFTRTSKARGNDMTIPTRLWKALEPQIQKHINRLRKELREEDMAQKSKRPPSSTKDDPNNDDKDFGK